MKKLVSLVLALVMVLAMGSFAVADEAPIALTWAMGTGAGAPADNAMVLEELNKMATEKLNVTCDIQYYTGDELQLSINSGEVHDMYFTCSWYNNFNQGVSNGLFANLAPVIAEWTPDLYATMDETIWNLAKSSDGGLYAIPVKKDYAPENFIAYPADKAVEVGVEIPDVISSWDELTDYLVKWKATIGENEYPVMIGGAAAGMETSFDFIDRTIMIGVVYGAEEATKVVSVFEDANVVDRYKTLYKWYNLGLVNPDAATATETSILTDVDHQHISFVQAWDGYDYTVSNGYNTAMTRYSGPYLSTDGVQGSMNALSVTLEEDEARFKAALQYQELVNTDKLFRDTLRYGVQGYHWNYVTEEQSAECAGGVLRTGTGDYAPWAFSQGSYELASIEVSNDQVNGLAKAPVMNQWEMYYESCADATVSAICGFTWNSENCTSQIAQISAIKGTYMSQLATGTGEDPETLIPQFMEELNAAGLQDCIDDAQAQLDAYLATK